MNILVTGGCGYKGTVLTQKLIACGHTVTVVDVMWFGNYLQEQNNLKVVKEDIRNIDSIPLDGVDVIIHLANVANDPCTELDPKLSWEINVLGTMLLAEKAVRSGVKQFIYASSGSVYGIKEEADVTEDLPLQPISEYNKTKMVAERVLQSYKDDMLVQIIRPATVCGYSPRMRLDLSVNMLAMQALVNKKITVFGGSQIRPNVHIDDLTDVYLYLLDIGKKAQGVYNCGFENLSIMDIARKVVEHIPAEIVVTESNDPRSYRLNSAKLISTGFKPKKRVDDAIQEVINAYQKRKLSDKDLFYNVRWMKKTLVR
jgi:nucleoside-diphosphate-sugar epimerase